MDNYYSGKLNSSNLLKVYDTKLERVIKYLDEEINFVRRYLTGNERVLELGAGYGRIIKELSGRCFSVTGIDISTDNVSYGREYLRGCPNCEILCMDVNKLSLTEKYDVVLCLQNGLSSIKTDGGAAEIVRQAVKLLNPGGSAFFSTYSPKFWDYRLKWFEEQAGKGLIGKIDRDKTRDGNIECEDGFKSRILSQEELVSLGRSSGFPYNVLEHDSSSVFLSIKLSNLVKNFLI